VAVFIFALNGTSPAQEEKPAQVEISRKIIEKEMPVYGTSLRRIIRKTEKKLERVNKELEKQQNEKLALEYFQEGNDFLEKGDTEEAKKRLEKALALTKDHKLKKKIQKSLRKK